MPHLPDIRYSRSTVAANAGALGSVDANTGDTLLVGIRINSPLMFT